MKSGTREQSRVLVRQYGYDRETLMKHVRKLLIGNRMHLPFGKPSAS